MIELVIEGRRKDLGDGFEVARILPYMRRRMVGPFVFLDHMGPTRFAPGGGLDVRPHPHIGLSTVTYLFDGEIHHRDSLGVSQAIRPGAVNWMTAGSGIVHSERTDPALRAHGPGLHGVQAWVALPEADEEMAPAFDHYPAETLPVLSDRGVTGHLIAGEAYGLTSGVKTRSPLFYLHVDLDPGAVLPLPQGHDERAAYVVTGALEAEGRSIPSGAMAVFGPGGAPHVAAGPDGARIMVLGGAALGPRHIFWNFVSSRPERIEQAKADWKAGRLALPPDDAAEFIPLPEA